MKRWMLMFAAGAVLLPPCPAPACSLCGINFLQSPSFRQEAAGDSARLILYGQLANPQLKADGNGTTELRILTVLRSHPFLGDKKSIEIQRYLPVTDPKNPPKFLVFCDVFMNKLDPYRGVPIKDASAIEYLKKALTQDPKDRLGSLAFFFQYLDHSDPEVSRDAFLEFAKAGDQEIGRLGGRLDAAKLRKWLEDPKTPAERIGLYSFLLASCGGEKDGDLLKKLLDSNSERTLNAYDGILSGYIHLRPKEGWSLALTALADGKKPLPIRLCVMRTLRFYQGWQPKESRANVLKGLSVMLLRAEGELADLAIEDLRRFQMWDLTRDVLGAYGRKGYDAPIVQRAILRYALSCDDALCREFLAQRRQTEGELVKEVEESLKFEKK